MQEVPLLQLKTSSVLDVEGPQTLVVDILSVPLPSVVNSNNNNLVATGSHRRRGQVFIYYLLMNDTYIRTYILAS